MYESVQNTFDSCKNYNVKVTVFYFLSVNILCFQKLFVLIFYNFNAWKQRLTQSDQNHKREDEYKTKDDCENHINRIYKLEWEKWSKLRTQLKRNINDVWPEESQDKASKKKHVFQKRCKAVQKCLVPIDLDWFWWLFILDLFLFFILLTFRAYSFCFSSFTFEKETSNQSCDNFDQKKTHDKEWKLSQNNLLEV